MDEKDEKIAILEARITELEQDCDKHHDLTILCLETDLAKANKRIAEVDALKAKLAAALGKVGFDKRDGWILSCRGCRACNVFDGQECQLIHQPDCPVGAALQSAAPILDKREEQ